MSDESPYNPHTPHSRNEHPVSVRGYILVETEVGRVQAVERTADARYIVRRGGGGFSA